MAFILFQNKWISKLESHLRSILCTIVGRKYHVRNIIKRHYKTKYIFQISDLEDREGNKIYFKNIQYLNQMLCYDLFSF